MDRCEWCGNPLKGRKYKTIVKEGIKYRFCYNCYNNNPHYLENGNFFPRRKTWRKMVHFIQKDLNIPHYKNAEKELQRILESSLETLTAIEREINNADGI